MSNPKVSVVMPNYNAGEFLFESIESILSQTFSDFEFIIIDDGSTDNSWEIIQEFATKDSRIVPLRNEKNLRICETLNRGIKIARGEYIARMDSDDIAMPEWISRVLEFLEKKENKDVGVCGTNFFIVNKDGEKIGKKTFPKTDAQCKNAFWFRNPFGHNTVLIRKKCFDEFGYYNGDFIYAEDLELWMRFGQKYKLRNIQEMLVKYRVFGENSTLKNQKKMIESALKARKLAQKKYGYKMPFAGKIHYFATWLAQFFPPKFVFWVFNLTKRNS
jgi:glycosyltransferase involved in cell wall biosynthesis